MNEHLSKEKVYWQQKLVDLPRLNLPTDRHYPDNPLLTTQLHYFAFPKNLIGGINKLVQQEETELFPLLLTVFNILLYRYTGQTDIPVSILASNQNEKKHLADTLILRTSFENPINFKSLLKIIRNGCSEAYENQNITFKELLSVIDDNATFAQFKKPLIQVGFNFTSEEKHISHTKFDLYFEIKQKGNELSGQIEYQTELYDKTTIERMVTHYQTLLSSIIENSEQAIDRLNLLTEEERNQLLAWSVGPKSVTPDLCVHQIFEEHVAKNPSAIAVSANGENLTYEQLNMKANQLAHYLCKLGVKSGDIVAISMQQSMNLIVSILGILKANAIYVSLDPSYPIERLLYMLEDTKAPILITQSDLTEKFSEHNGKLLCLDTLSLSNESTNNPNCTRTPNDLLYIVYTSGSTGEPKGIKITHQAVVKLVINTNYIEIGADDIVAQASNISFDAATFEIFGSLLNGAHLKVILRDILLSPNQLKEFLTNEKITILFVTTALFNQLVKPIPEIFNSLRYILFGGERIEPDNVKKVFLAGSPSNLIHVYGPTETTTFATWSRIEKVSSNTMNLPIGRPIANTDVYVLDSNCKLQPIGIPGEIFIGGNLVSKGYFNKNKLTKASFIKNIFSEKSSQYLYKTGDLGCYKSDGNIEFLGRIDQQIKIRGFRVEINEVNSTLSKCSKVKQTYVTDEVDGSNNKYLIAYVVLNNPDEAPLLSVELQQFLQRKLPEYMVPRYFIILESLPLTANGKVDAKALCVAKKRQLSPDFLNSNDSEVPYIAPQTPIEKILMLFWRELLEVKRVGCKDDFFKLGGYSLLGMHLITQIRENFGFDISIKDLFEHPMLEQFAKLIERKNHQSEVDLLPKIRKTSHNHEMPVSFQQQQIWLIAQLDPVYTAYNETMTIYFHENVNTEILEESINTIIKRHAILRTAFKEINSELKQVHQTMVPFKLDISDLQMYSESERENRALILATELVQQPFDLKNPPLFRAILIKFSKHDSRLYFCIHHIIFDGESFLIFMRELEAIYLSLQSKKQVLLRPLPVQFSDYACWQRRQFTDEVLSKQKVYWQKKLMDLPRLNLPTDRNCPETLLLTGAVQHFNFSDELIQSLSKLAQQEGTTLFILLLTAFKTLLYRYTGQTDIPVGTVISKRNQTETEPLIGYLIDNLIIRTNFDETVRFSGLLKAVKKACNEAYANQDVPYEQLVQIVNPDRCLGQRQNPLAQVFFSFEPEPKRFPKSQLGWEFEHMVFHSGFVKSDLYFEIEHKNDGLLGRVEYSSELFDKVTIERMIGHYQTLLLSITENMNQSIEQLNLLTKTERNQILTWSTGPKNSVPDLCVHQIFEEQVTKNPSSIAVSANGESLTYEQLNLKANQLAHHLCKLGIKPGDVVAISLEQSLDLIISILAILKADAIYTLLDPKYPAERLKYMLDDVQAPILITQSYLIESFQYYQSNLLCLDRIYLGKENTSNLECIRTSNDVLYIVYTSGSTGKPKGIKITHQAVVKLIINTNYIKISPDDVIAQTMNPSFDVFTFEIYGALLYGSCLKVISKEILLSPVQFNQFLLKEKVTILVLTTALFNQLAAALPHIFKVLKYVLFAGERVDPRSITRIITAGKPQHLINCYGPAEATTFATAYEIQESDKGMLNIPIGKSIGYTEVYILNKSLQPQPVGIPGEIYIGGDRISLGYLNNASLINAHFVKNPFSEKYNQLLYCTGDIASYKPDGNIQFLGRIDQQIKIRGFRVEIGEVLSVLNQHSCVNQAYITNEVDIANNQHLIAYVVPNSPDKFSLLSMELRQFLQEKLPEYMIPDFFIIVEKLPLTTNGKIDTNALPKRPNEPISMIDYISPKTNIEITIMSEIANLLNRDEHALSMGDDFFEIGGNSLLALQLMSNLIKKFFVHIDFSILYQTKTIQEISDKITPLIETSLLYKEDFTLQSYSSVSSLIQMQNGSNDAEYSLFFAPAAGGQVLFYRNLVQYIDKQIPIYGFRAVGFGKDEKPYIQIEDMANNYLKILKKIQPRGPYYLIGASSGGLIVYEMAQQLLKKNEKIGLLMLIDTPDPTKVSEFQDDSEILQFFFSTILQLAIQKEELLNLDINDQVNYILGQGKKAKVLPPDYRAEHIHQILNIFKATYIASAHYKPNPIPGQGWYIKAAEKGLLIDFPHEKIWQNLFQHLHLVTVPGNHVTLLQEPNVKRLAGYLNKALAMAEVNLEKV
ncbi:MAG: amino acid adenylation domain-containing protein [Proteobacteria bacterium]|nr:amino acid adenylation domain-containing protein [Pseudomonadota bacterium]